MKNHQPSRCPREYIADAYACERYLRLPVMNHVASCLSLQVPLCGALRTPVGVVRGGAGQGWLGHTQSRTVSACLGACLVPRDCRGFVFADSNSGCDLYKGVAKAASAGNQTMGYVLAYPIPLAPTRRSNGTYSTYLAIVVAPARNVVLVPEGATTVAWHAIVVLRARNGRERHFGDVLPSVSSCVLRCEFALRCDSKAESRVVWTRDYRLPENRSFVEMHDAGPPSLWANASGCVGHLEFRVLQSNALLLMTSRTYALNLQANAMGRRAKRAHG